MNINKVKVSNHWGVPNQFIIKTDEGEFFQSYESIIAFIPRGVSWKNEENKGKILLDEKYWDYSKTTGKYRNLFLSETKKETEQRIKEGFYILTNLN